MSANISVFIGGQKLSDPIDVLDIVFLAQFDDDASQPTIGTEEAIFTGTARDAILKHIRDGLSGGVGIFEGIALDFVANDGTNTVELNYYIDLTDGFQGNDAEQRLRVALRKRDGIDSAISRLEGRTFDNLVEEGIITDADYQIVPYVVKAPFNFVEQLTLAITLYLLLKEVAETIEKAGETQAVVAGDTADVPPNPSGGGVSGALLTIARIIYFTTMTLIIVRLIRQIVNTFLPPKREHKAINLRVALEKIFGSIGYKFSSEIDLLDRLFYLPSNPNFDQSTFDGLVGRVGSIEQGIPNPQDYGNLLTEFVQLVRDSFLADVAIIGDTAHLNWKGSDFFLKQANVTLPDVLDKPFTYNTDEAYRTSRVSTQFDYQDTWTIDDSQGRTYGVQISPIQVNDEKLVTLTGIQRKELPYALGSRNDSLNALERALESLLSVVDNTIGVLGGAFGLDVDLSKAITDKIGMLKVSNNNHSVPKILYLDGNGKLPANHRDLFSAKVLWENFHFWTSFASNADNAQKKVFNDIEAPFTLDQFKNATDNAYIYNTDGTIAKYTSIEYIPLQDKARIGFYERRVYTRNLKETIIT